MTVRGLAKGPDGDDVMRPHTTTIPGLNLYNFENLPEAWETIAASSDAQLVYVPTTFGLYKSVTGGL